MIMILSSMIAATLYMAMHMDTESSVACEDVAEKIIYLAVGEEYQADTEFVYDGEIIACDGGIIRGMQSGEAVIDSGCIRYIFRVSDLYTVEKTDMDKPYLPANAYSSAENAYLDEVLAYLIADKGYQTRAGALEAARFLTLRFPYKLLYFYENGRLDPQAEYHVDGEGRYYHQGLYLNGDKYQELSEVENGPAFWGMTLYEDYNGEYKANGLDCSGFVTWCLYNAGYDVGDIGAGPEEGVYDLSDLGVRKDIEDVEIAELQPGDLAGLDGHIGMIIGIDSSHIYVAEAYWVNDLQVRVYDHEQFLQASEWEYVLLMDEFYGPGGDITAMWN